MNSLWLVLAVTSAVTSEARADSPEPLPLTRLAKAGEKPVGTATSERDCPGGGDGIILAGSRTIGPARITLMHQCGMGDEGGMMSIRIGRAYFNGDIMLIHYTGANMTEAPERRSLVSDRVYAGTLADRTTAVVQAVTTHARFVNNRTDKVEREEWGLRVQVCSLGDAPACATANDVLCPAGGCAVPTLSRGTLRIVDKDRRAHTYAVVPDPDAQAMP